MISDKQKAMAARIAAELREHAQAVEDSVNEDANVRDDARLTLKLAAYRDGLWRLYRLPVVELETTRTTLLYDVCPECQEGELKRGEALCEMCAEGTVTA